jgi:hypothetical protein
LVRAGRSRLSMAIWGLCVASQTLRWKALSAACGGRCAVERLRPVTTAAGSAVACHYPLVTVS